MIRLGSLNWDGSKATRVAVDGEDIDSFAKGIWESLDEENKVSLFVRYIEIETGRYESRIINKNV